MHATAMMLEVGRIVKPHGLRGEVIVELFTNREERVAPGSELSAPGGVFVVRKATPHQHRWIVQFAGINHRNQAEALRDTVLSAEPLDDPDALWVHELVGAEVLDASGEKVGEVVSVISNPAGDILDLGDNTLVPLRFVVEHGPGFVRIDPPPGLLEVNN